MEEKELKNAELIEKAQEWVSEKKYEDVINALEPLLDQPDLSEEEREKIMYLVATSYRRWLKFEKAIEYFKKLLEKKPNDTTYLIELADSYRGLKDWEKALEVWYRYLKLEPKDYLVMTRVGDAYRKLRKFDKAEQTYLAALQINPNNKFALMGLGDMFYKNGEYDKALKYWEKLLEIRPDILNILTMVGNIYRRRKEFAKAIGYYQRALGIDPENFYAIYGVACAYEGLKRYKEAINYWKRLYEREPNNLRIIIKYVEPLKALKKYEEIENIFQRLYDNLEEILYSQKGLNLSLSGEEYDGLTAQERKEKDEKTIVKNLLEAKIGLKKYDEAIRIAKEYLKKHPNDVKVVLLLGEALEKSNRIDEAKELYSKYTDKVITSRLSRLMIKDFEKSTDKI